MTIPNPKLRLLKNAAANVFRGGSASLVAVILPSFLTRYMSPAAYGVWMLVLQVAAYVNFLDFGIQTTVGRFVAHANERNDSEHRNRVVTTSLVILCLAAVAGIVCSIVMAVFMHAIFSKLPFAFLQQARSALLIVAISMALGLPASVFNAVFVGLHRNEVPAVIIALKNLVAGASIVWIAHSGGTIVHMAEATALVNVVAYATQYVAYEKITKGGWIAASFASRSTAREIVSYCQSLTIWSFAMLLVTGLDLTLVGIFDFRAVPYYAVASTLVTLLAGFQNAIFAAMVPYTAMLHAGNKRSELGHSLFTATRYGLLLLLLTGLPLLFVGDRLMGIWVGPNYAQRSFLLLQVLVTANIVRLSMTPYIVTLIGTGQQRLVTISPMLEGFSNLVSSVAAAYFWGAIGIAIGTLIGAIVGVLCHYVYNMPRTSGVEFTITRYLRDAIAPPLICSVPLAFYLVMAGRLAGASFSAQLALLAVVAALTGIFVWRWRTQLPRLQTRVSQT